MNIRFYRYAAATVWDKDEIVPIPAFPFDEQQNLDDMTTNEG
jgi:hypothetical protein